MKIEGFETRVIREAESYTVLQVRDPEWKDGMTMDGAWTKAGDYIGDPEVAEKLCDEKGITPELRTPECSVCSIGYCAKEKKWYGWSHRAIYGFRVGDRFYDKDGPGTGIINTHDEARLSAINYAESAS